MSQSQQLPEEFHALVRQKARRVAGRFGFSRSDRDDIEQELCVCLLTRMRGLDEGVTNREAFVTTVLDRCVATLMRRMRAQKRSQRGETSLSVGLPDEDGQTVSGDKTVSEAQNRKRIGDSPLSDFERVELEMDVATVVDRLPSDLRPLAQLLQEHSLSECARQLGISRTTLQYQMAQLREASASSGFEEKSGSVFGNPPSFGDGE